MPIWVAFVILTNRRVSNQQGPQPIAFSEIIVYLNEEGLEGEDREEYLHLITALDQEYLDYHRGELKKATDRANAKAKAASRSSSGKR